LIGSAVWEAFYLAGGNKVPHPPGVWDVFFIAAQILVIAALVLAMRSLISFRLASLDSVIVTAAGIALAAPFVRHGLENGANPASIITLNRPILSIVILMVVASAAITSWEGVPLSMAMLGLAEAALTVGNLIYTFEAVQDRYVDQRWATLAWGAGAILALLAASTLILRIDRPIRLSASVRIPNHPVGSTRVLLISLGGLVLSCGVASYGLAIASRGVAIAGVASCVAIGVAMAFRATGSIRTAEAAYGRLDHALAETENARDELARANVEIQTIQIAFADLLNLADERTDGRIRELIEATGHELAELLEEESQRSGVGSCAATAFECAPTRHRSPIQERRRALRQPPRYRQSAHLRPSSLRPRRHRSSTSMSGSRRMPSSPRLTASGLFGLAWS
jgi:hypothetical protein